MIKLLDWDKEDKREFESQEDARAWLLGKLTEAYIYRISDEDIETLANRMGYEVKKGIQEI